MTKEDKQILLRDLCARLPYGVVIEITSDGGMVEASYNMRLDAGLLADLLHSEDDFMPYLRPISSMTYEEREEAREKFFNGSDHYDIDDIGEIYADTYQPYTTVYTLSFARLSGYIDWLNAHHFDYRGLIPMGIALEAPKNMYNKE